MRASASTFAALAFAVGACASDTGIVIEVSWTEADFPAAETLRIYVATGDPTRAAVDEASVAEPVEMITLPYRYLLRPDGALGDIGPLVLAAGLTAGEPPQPLAFDVYPEAVAFADGEIRTVRLTPTSRTYESHGPNAACAIYADDLGQPRTIGLPGDADCDGTLDGSDCAPLEPTDDVDGDGVTCDVDCLDSGGSVRYSPGGLEVLIKPESVFPGQNVRDFRMLNAVPPHIECLHVDFDCSGQCRDEAKLPGGPPVVVETDASGADDCGSIFAAEDPPLCPIAPSDCDPDQPENQSTTESESEICDGRDTDCDGFLATPILCTQPEGADCQVGARACDDGSGRFADGCEIVGRATVPGRLCELAASRLSCRLDEDPLGCVVDQISAGDLVRECPVSFNCDPDVPETVGLPDLGTGTCTWTVVGGSAQGDWTVGFVRPGSFSIEATSNLCSPVMGAMPRVGNPHDYTVLVAGTDGNRVIRRFHVVKLKADSNVCNGTLDCDLTLP
jgi:hypothetical protein